MKSLTLVVAGAVALSLTGCASILNDKTQTINVSTSNGANVSGTVDGQAFKAPGTVAVQRTKAAKIFLVDDPECAKSTAVDANVDSKFFINILSGGALGSTTDYSTEKMWKYSENVVISCGQAASK